MIHMVAARRHREETRLIYRGFRAANAVSPEFARALADLAIKDSAEFQALRRRRVIREVNVGRFYLDEDARREYQWLVLRWTAVPISLLLAFLIYAIARA